MKTLIDSSIKLDIRRRYTFGFTIADNMMSLWYSDRERAVRTCAFDFIKVRSVEKNESVF